jgi:hypothetical protein
MCMAWESRKIGLIESNVKCRYLKKLTCKETLRQEFYLFEALSPPKPPYPPPLLHTVNVYSHMGRGGKLTREKVRGAIVHKAGRKYQHD